MNAAGNGPLTDNSASRNGGGPVPGAGVNPNATNHHNHPPSHHNLNPRDLYSHQAINGYMPNGYAFMGDPSPYTGKFFHRL